MVNYARKVNLVKPLEIDKITITRDGYFVDAYMIDLPLDAMPDHVWQDIFEREWRSSRHLWDRKLFVLGDRLRLITSIDDFEEKLNWVKQVIERTNMLVDEYDREIQTHLAHMEERDREILEDKAHIEMIRSMLRKVFG
ncbi:MAG: hypothetical protein QXX51_05125 [Candidatus Bathyarchaeia archaeon]